MIRGTLIAALLLLASGGCSFSGAEGDNDGGGGGGGEDDGGGSGSGPDAKPPPPPRCEFTHANVCALTAGAALNYTSNTIIDTTAACPHSIGQGEERPALCVFYASSVTIAANVTVRAIGNRPLAFISSGAITITGTLTASGARARQGGGNPPTPEIVGAGGGVVDCNDFTAEPDNSTGGGGGGAGATFSGKGGNGGKGKGDAGAGAAPDPLMPEQITFLRGGCRGQKGATGDEDPNAGTPGAGGPPGGSLYLAASGDITIASTGRIAANGGGGKGGGSITGGGGGGSGGVIILEGKAIHRLGMIVANGGAGGQGGFISTVTNPPSRVSGNDGGDGEMSGAAAQGGNAPFTNGQGGDSSDSSQRNGRDGGGGNATGVAGGGGGGGAAGFIRILGPNDGGGMISPPAS